MTHDREFPAYEDLPRHLQRMVRRQPGRRCYAPDAMDAILKWVRGFVNTVCGTIIED